MNGTPAATARSASPVASTNTSARNSCRPPLLCTITPLSRSPSSTGATTCVWYSTRAPASSSIRSSTYFMPSGLNQLSFPFGSTAPSPRAIMRRFRSSVRPRLRFTPLLTLRISGVTCAFVPLPPTLPNASTTSVRAPARAADTITDCP